MMQDRYTDHVDGARAALARWLSEDTMEPPRVEPPPPDHRWRCASAWQKAIRRGDVPMALEMAARLWAMDRKYVLYRLPVILFEDVGWADPELVSVGVIACQRAASWLGADAERAAMLFTRRAAAGVKDRSMIDLEAATDRMYVVRPEVKAMFLEPSVATRVDVVHDLGADPFVRMAALWSLAGPTLCPAGHALLPYPVDRESLLDIVDGIGDRGAMMMRIGMRLKSGMAAAAVIIATELAAAEAAGTMGVESDGIPRDPMIGDYRSSTYDQYTREGKAAIASFAKACRPWASWLVEQGVPAGHHRDVTARFLFQVESRLMDRRLTFGPVGHLIHQAPLLSAAALYGIGPEQAVWGRSLLSALLGEMDAARARVAEGRRTW